MAGSSRHVVCPHCQAVNRVPADRQAKRANCGSCHRPLFTGKPFAATGESLDRHLTRNDVPVVVDFWAPWCGPCRTMAPAYESAAAELEPDYRLLKVNTEEEPALASCYDVRGIPMLILFAEGTPKARTSGAMTTAGIVPWVRAHRLVPPQAASAGG